MRLSLHLWKKKRRGSALIEVAIGFALLMIVSLMLLRLSMIALASRAWIVRQTLSDAYCTRESALAKRTPFAALEDPATLWPTGVANAAMTNVTMGTLGVTAGNAAQRTVTGTLKRYKTPIVANLPNGVGDGVQLNPAASTSYLLTSVLSYSIGGQQYYKTRSTVRTQ